MTAYTIATTNGDILKIGIFSNSGQRPVKEDQMVIDGKLYWVWNVVWEEGLLGMVVILTTHAESQYSRAPAIKQAMKRIREKMK